jgi:hypothetical protein
MMESMVAVVDSLSTVYFLAFSRCNAVCTCPSVNVHYPNRARGMHRV